MIAGQGPAGRRLACSGTSKRSPRSSRDVKNSTSRPSISPVDGFIRATRIRRDDNDDKLDIPNIVEPAREHPGANQPVAATDLTWIADGALKGVMVRR
jgi:hypothetical protein